MATLADAIAVPYLTETLAFLFTVVIVVPVCKRLKISPIMGFLAIGAAIGPYSLQFVTNVETVQHIAELGVIFLLFTIGLELSFERLRVFAAQIFGLGGMHFLLSASAIALAALTWGNTTEAAIVIGLCLALSSTAVVMQILNERGEMASVHGRATFSVLLLQDLMVVPVLIIVTVLGQETDGSLSTIIFKSLFNAVAAVVLIIVLGRYVLRYLFRIAAKTRAAEVFMAATLLAILLTSALTGIAGLSMALGAFLAGLLLAETEFKHQIETDIDPFKGLFLGLFFMGVGMNVDFQLAFERGYWVWLSVIGLLGLKICAGITAGMLFKLPFKHALRMALLLAEAGEFAFLVIGQASLNYSIIDVKVGQFMVVVAGISMVLTPVLAYIGETLTKQMDNGTLENLDDNHMPIEDHVIIAGFGRVGNEVAKILNAQAIPYIGLDLDSENIKRHQQNNHAPIFHGDASNPKLLHKAGVEHALAVLLTMDDADAALKTVHSIRSQWPTLPIIVRSKHTEHSQELIEAGATKVVPELYESSLLLAGHVLRSGYLNKEETEACIELVRQHNYKELGES